jgi:hypothetical protein
MRSWTRKLVIVLATGYVLFFYSERMFWSFLRPGDKPVDFVLGWLVYSVMAWVFLLLVRHCRIAAFSAVFLAGAAFGWLAEGIVVDTMCGNKGNPFPASISFTGLAWHALISVGVGWYWQARLLTAGNRKKIALFSVAVGLGWGLWAGWWPAELGRANTSLAAFTGHTLACSTLLIGARLILALAGSEWFRPAKYELAVLLAVVALFFFVVRIPATPRCGVDTSATTPRVRVGPAPEPEPGTGRSPDRGRQTPLRPRPRRDREILESDHAVVPVKQTDLDQLPRRTPKTQAKAAPMLTCRRFTSCGKSVDEVPEADWTFAVSVHGLHELSGQRMFHACQGRIEYLRSVGRSDDYHTANYQRPLTVTRPSPCPHRLWSSTLYKTSHFGQIPQNEIAAIITRVYINNNVDEAVRVPSLMIL